MAAAGVIMTPPERDVARRLLALEAGLEEWLDAHRPDAVAVERVFSQHNVRTVMGTAQAGAVAIVCAARRGLPVALHTPSEVKAAVTGSGRADKAQVTGMVTRLLRLGRPAPARGRGGRAGAGHLPPVARRRAAPPGRGRRAGRAVPAARGRPGTGGPAHRSSTTGGSRDRAPGRHRQRRRPGRRGDRRRRGRAPGAPAPRARWPGCGSASGPGWPPPWWSGRTR